MLNVPGEVHRSLYWLSTDKVTLEKSNQKSDLAMENYRSCKKKILLKHNKFITLLRLVNGCNLILEALGDYGKTRLE